MMVEDIKIDSVEEKKEKQVETVPQQPNSENNKDSSLKNYNINENKTSSEEILQRKEEKDESKDQEEENEELNIDLKELKSKTIGFFKGFKNDNKLNLKESKDEEASKEEDISFDFKKISSFTKNNAKWLIPLALILIAIIFSTYFRVMPSYLPVTDDWAENTVYNFYQQQISNQINQQYPNLPDQNRQSLINTEWKKQLKENKDQINNDIKQLSNQYKDNFQNENGQTYLLAIDPYLWYNQVRNHVDHGNPGTNVVEGKYIDFLRNGKEGKITQGHPHVTFISWLHQFISLFNSNQTIIASVFLAPIILIALAMIPAFFIGYRLKGSFAGLITALLVAINPILLSRTAGGFSDTDPYHIFFPLLAIWFLVEFLKRDSLKEKVTFSVLLALVYTIYAQIWMAWFIFDIVIGIIILDTIITGFKNRNDKNIIIQKTKMIVISLITFFAVGMALGKYIQGSFVIIFNRMFLSPLSALKVKEVATSSLWPNVLTTVAELNKGSFSQIINTLGGKFMLVLSIIALMLIFYESIKKKETKNISIGVMLMVYYLVASIATLIAGIRFAMFTVIPLAISSGYLFHYCFEKIPRLIKKHLYLAENVGKILVGIIIILIISPQISSAYNVGTQEVPSMNDAWYDTLTNVKNNSTDAIITSWWDFGHWFVAISERRVTFDGGDQGERIHWVGKSLLTSNEQESIGLLRMLNCGQQEAVHVLEEFFDGNTVRAVEMLNEITTFNDKNKAIKYLSKERLSNEQIAKVMKLTYCDDLIEQYFITSEDMVGKAGVWGHFGGWNFEKASMYQTVSNDKNKGKQLLQDNFDLDENQAEEYYYQIINTPADQWVSDWPGYQGNAQCTNTENNKTLQCPINLGQGTAVLEINLKTMNATVPSNQGNFYPNSLVYAGKEKVEEKKFKENLLGISVILLPNNQIILSHPLQAKSMFTQLFFFDGYGLDCFSKFDEKQQITGGKIVVWKVDFGCQQ
jgi:dolichyl-phosphooligosaccharide-protein glycotransferase